MPERKEIDIYVAVDGAELADSTGRLLTPNILRQQVVRGDQLLLRWHCHEGQNTTAFVMPVGAKFEFVVADNVPASNLFPELRQAEYREVIALGRTGGKNYFAWIGAHN